MICLRVPDRATRVSLEASGFSCHLAGACDLLAGPMNGEGSTSMPHPEHSCKSHRLRVVPAVCLSPDLASKPATEHMPGPQLQTASRTGCNRCHEPTKLPEFAESCCGSRGLGSKATGKCNLHKSWPLEQRAMLRLGRYASKDGTTD